MTPTHFILVPGYWLGGWAWDRVLVPLQEHGHLATPVTLPGLESTTADRSGITLADHVDALADVVADVGSDAVLVAHSGAGKVVSGLLDRSPEAVRRVVYVDSGPTSDGVGDDVGPELVELPLPTWEELASRGASIEGLSTADLDEFRARAVPHPARVARDRTHLTNPARRRVPSTIVACSLPSSAVSQLAASGHPMFAEVAELTDLSYVDLPTGHWPLWSKPTELAAALSEAAESRW